MSIIIYYDDQYEEKIQTVRGIAPENETGNLIIWYTEKGENCFRTIKYTDYIKIVIL